MQIACPQCAMQYVLDERLLPPGGAPVQCTRCSHVFTAVPGNPQRASNPGTATPKPGERSGGTAARTSTQVFGGRTEAPAREAPSVARSTQVFGAVPPRASTQVFGTQGTGEAPPRASTQVFGAQGAADAPPRASTQVFGTPAVGAPPRASTQVFGSGASAEPPPPPRASTQVFGAPLGGEGSPASAGEPARRASTQVFGAAVPPAEAPPAPRASTQVFGAPVPPAEAPPRASTQVFGSVASDATPAAPPSPGAPAARASTQVFGAPAVAETPRGSTQVFGAVQSAEGAAPRAARVDLPPDLLDAPTASRGHEPRARPSAPEASRKTLWLVLAAALLAALAFLAWRTVQRRGAAFPLQSVTARDGAATLLRRDDARSRQEAIAALEQVVREHPTYVEAQAELVSALAFELDDARVQRGRARTQELAVQRERMELERARAPEGWERDARQLRAAEAGHREEVQLQTRRADEASRRAEEALRLMDQPPADEVPAAGQLARARAHALLASVHGAPGTPELIQRLRASGDPQGWDAIAQAQYALNATSPALDAAGRRDAGAALEALRQRDAAFLRAYVLGARLSLASGDARGAAALLDMALALNPAHEVARVLQDVARAGHSLATPAP